MPDGLRKDIEIINNRNLVVTAMKADGLAILKQVHGDQIYNATSKVMYKQEPTADGLITHAKNLALAIQTADCAPVFLSDERGSVIAALHCGWKGAISMLIPNAIAEIKTHTKCPNIRAAIGPCIHQKSYEVNSDFYDLFMDQDADNKRFFIMSKRKSHYLFDLPQYIVTKIKKYGVHHIKLHDYDTYTGNYFSYRRSTHQNEKEQRRMLSVIVAT